MEGNIQVGNVGDEDPQADQNRPCLSSLLQDLAHWNATRPKTEVEEPSSSENNEWKRKLYECRPVCGRLLQAAMKGDWLVAKAVLDKHPDFVQLPITMEEATLLHSAAAAKRTYFVQELLNRMTRGDLELRTIDGDTALHVAAQTGEVKIAEEMVKKNNELPFLHNYRQMIPLHAAADKRDRKMVDFLFSDSVTPFSRLTTPQRIELFLLTVSAGFYDLALKILEKDTNLATANTADGACGRSALEKLAREPFAISRRSEVSSWEKRLNSCHKWIYEIGLMPACLADKWIMIYNNTLMRTCAHQLVEELWKMVYAVPWKFFSSEILPVHDQMSLLVEAAKVGNLEFLHIILHSYPDLLWQLIDEKYGISLFHIAIIYRQGSVFNLIHKIGFMKEKITTYIAKGDNNVQDITKGDNMLHFAGKLAPLYRLNIISNEAFQMQQELLWFQEVEKIVPHSYVNMMNSKNETPRDIFKKAHEDLHKKAKKWMKETATNCMLVATLIATVVFTAAFTVPGGNNQEVKDHDKGKPLLLNSNWFTVFFVSDAIALIFSSTSILVFLSILTSPYREEDFLKTIPQRLLGGLAALFISIAGMVSAFSATCFLVYYSKAVWDPIVITALATIPIIHFVQAYFRLWIDTINSLIFAEILTMKKDRLQLASTRYNPIGFNWIESSLRFRSV